MAIEELYLHSDFDKVSLRDTFPSSDQVGKLTVFNIGGNKVRFAIVRAADAAVQNVVVAAYLLSRIAITGFNLLALYAGIILAINISNRKNAETIK